MTPEQDESEESNLLGENPVSMCVGIDPTEASMRQTHNQRINTDYIHKKKRKRTKHLPAVTLNAVRNTDNPNHPNTRVLLRYDETMGVSAFVVGAPLLFSEENING